MKKNSEKTEQGYFWIDQGRLEECSSEEFLDKIEESRVRDKKWRDADVD